MNDYGFGNFLTELRTGCGLSQFQLGKLVGVSDKAVSKWENGAAKPRLEVCQKLARLFHLSVSDLLNCRNPLQDAEMDDERIWDKCRARLREVYGNNPPTAFTVRLEAERNAFRGQMLVEMADLSEQILPQMECNMAADIKSSLAAWLLGASVVNPLKPHAYCPNCKKVVLHPEAHDAWDLPQSVCECGTRMIREGHDIPLSIVLAKYGSTKSHVEFQLHANDFEKLLDTLTAYFGSHFELIECRIAELDEIGMRHYSQKYGYRQFALVKRSMAEAFKAQYAQNEITYQRWRDLKEVYPTILLAPVPDSITNQNKEAVPNPSDIITPELLEKAYRLMRTTKPGNTTATLPNGEVQELRETDALCDVAAYAEHLPKTMFVLMQILALYYPKIAWTRSGKAVLDSGIASLTQLPATAEQAWLDIVEKMKTASWFELGFADQVMQGMSGNTYFKKGIDDDTRNALQELGFPQWYIDFVGHSAYACKKEALIDTVLNRFIIPAYRGVTQLPKGYDLHVLCEG